jgi:hypothetical protein
VPGARLDYSRPVLRSSETTNFVAVVDFDALPLGVWSEREIAETFGAPRFTNGLGDGRVELVAESGDQRALRVHYPEGAVGPVAGGAQWLCALGASYEALTLSYELRFGDGFDFVLGGKLPGLAGGSANTGGDRPNGSDGFSARMMWRPGGKVVQYLYHPDQLGVWGDDLPWDRGGARSFRPGTWHAVRHEIVLNTPGRHDGVLRGFFDGELALERRDLRFRDVATLALDHFYFSTFFGGNTPEWGPTRDEHVDFAKVRVINGAA